MCCKDDDNIVISMYMHVRDPKECFIDDNYDWSLSIGPDFGEGHCYLFHSLYDHADFDWDVILRIKKIAVDFEMGCGVTKRKYLKRKAEEDAKTKNTIQEEQMAYSRQA